MYRISEFSVKFNRSAKAWELHNGKLKAVFDAGDEGKRAAVLGAIGLADTELYELVQALLERHPHLDKRIINAALLIHFHHVRKSRDLTKWSLAEILSQSHKPCKGSPRMYAVFQEHGVLRCGCADFRRAAATVSGKTVCKHILAYSMATWLDRLGWIEWEHKPLRVASHRGGTVLMKDYVSPSPEVFKL